MTNYRYTFKADSGELWRVTVFDLNYSGTDYATLYPDSSGFVISWEGASEETYQPIISSTVTITLHKDTNSVALLNAIIAGTDSQFVVMVSKKIGNGWFLMWKGSPLRDSLSRPDEANGVGYIEIRAIDGFGLLKDIEYSYGTPLSNYEVTNYLNTIFRALLDYDNFTTEASSELYNYVNNEDPTYITPVFTTASTWYEDSQNSSIITDQFLGDPMRNTKINESAFVTVDDYGIIKGMDLYTVLTEILNAFNLQVSQWNGTYLLIQQNTYSQTSTRFWDYDFPNIEGWTRLADLTNTIDRFTSGLFNHILPVKQVTTEYDYKQGIYANNLFPNDVNADTIYNLGASEIDAAQQYSGRIELLFTSDTASNGEFVAIYLLTIKCGSYYLKSNGSGTYWENTAGKITIRDYQSVFGTVVGTTSSIASFSFSGAPFPTDGDTVNFEWEFSHFENFIVPGTPIVIPGTNTYTYDDIEGSFIARIDTGVPMEGTQLFKATVSNGAKADLELQKSIIGDGANTYSAGALTVTNGANSYNSNVWSIYSDIGVLTMPLHSLRCKEMLALRRSTVQVFECPFNGEIDFHKAFVFESKNWLWLSAEFNCSQNRFSGTAMAIVLYRTNITVADVLTKVEQSGNSNSIGSSGISPAPISSISVEDGIFDLSFESGVIAVDPYASKGTTRMFYDFDGSNIPDGVTYLGLNSQLIATLFRVYYNSTTYGELIGSAFQFADGTKTGYFSFNGTAIQIYAEDADTSANLPVILGDSIKNVTVDPENDLFEINLADTEVNGTLSIGDIGHSNYSEFETDGTLVFHGDATTYNDLPPIPIASLRFPTAGAPTLANFVGGTKVFTFAVNDEVYGMQELMHEYEEGSTLEVHAHWTNMASDAGAVKVKWQLEYTIANLAASTPYTVFPATTTISAEHTLEAGTGGFSHIYTTIGTISGTGIKIGAYIVYTFKRIAKSAGGSDPSANPACIAIGFHFKQNTTGSRSVTGK